jgi:hypothetical protein
MKHKTICLEKDDRQPFWGKYILSMIFYSVDNCNLSLHWYLSRIISFKDFSPTFPYYLHLLSITKTTNCQFYAKFPSKSHMRASLARARPPSNQPPIMTVMFETETFLLLFNMEIMVHTFIDMYICVYVRSDNNNNRFSVLVHISSKLYTFPLISPQQRTGTGL